MVEQNRCMLDILFQFDTLLHTYGSIDKNIHALSDCKITFICIRCIKSKRNKPARGTTCSKQGKLDQIKTKS